jgi:hypothetical protein
MDMWAARCPAGREIMDDDDGPAIPVSNLSNEGIAKRTFPIYFTRREFISIYILPHGGPFNSTSFTSPILPSVARVLTRIPSGAGFRILIAHRQCYTSQFLLSLQAMRVRMDQLKPANLFTWMDMSRQRWNTLQMYVCVYECLWIDRSLETRSRWIDGIGCSTDQFASRYWIPVMLHRCEQHLGV